MVGEIDKWIAECGQLPIEHCHDPRLARMEEHVLDFEIAVDDGDASLAPWPCRQPMDEPFHRLDRLRLGSTVLPDPTVHLAANVFARLAEIAEAKGRRF